MEGNLSVWDKIQVKAETVLYGPEIMQAFHKLSDQYGVFIRYIVALFVFTAVAILLRITYKWVVLRSRASLSLMPVKSLNFSFWEKFSQEDERRYIEDLKEIFEEEHKRKTGACRKALQNGLPAGGTLFKQVLSAINQGLSDDQIIRIMPKGLAPIDILPIIDAIRAFRDLAASRILDQHAKDKRDYAKAFRDMSNGDPRKAVKLMNKKLVQQQEILFSLKDKLLQQYAKKEAAKMAMQVALITGVYDTRLADRAYKRAMELNPRDSKGLILYGRFRQRMWGDDDKVVDKSFLKVAKRIDKTLQNYMANYAFEMSRKSEIKQRQEEVRTRIQDEKERYNEAVNIERLKVEEMLRVERVRAIAQEARERQ